MKRIHALTIGIAVALVLLSILQPVAALAQSLSGIDQTTMFASMGQQWFNTLQGMAARLYGGLFTIEVIVVCIQGALYKDNITEFFQGFAFKILTATVMLAVIGNAGTIFPAVVGMFQSTAVQVIGSGSLSSQGATPNATNACFANAEPAKGSNLPTPDSVNSAQCNATTISNPSLLEAKFLGWAALYFAAADISRAADSAEGAIAGIVVFGTGVPGLSTAFLMGHENFSLFCIALGMTCVMSAAGILFTYILLTFETQIIMSIGVIFLAFQGSRFTAQFSQGYMSYAINIGTKFFVFYFMVSIVGAMVDEGTKQGLATQILGLAAGAAVPFGAMSITIAAASSNIPIICVISSVLIAAIPNFAGSLLSGGSALSASAALQSGAVSSMAGGIGGGMSSLGGGAMSGAAKSLQGSGSQGGNRPDMSTGAKPGSAPTLGPSGGPNGSTASNGSTGAPSGDAASESADSGTATGQSGSLGMGGPPGTSASSTPQNGSAGYGGAGSADDAVAEDAMLANTLGPAEQPFDEDAYGGSPVAGDRVDLGDDEDRENADDDDDSDLDRDRDPDNMDAQGEREQEEEDLVDQEVAEREAEHDRVAAMAGQVAGGAMMGATTSVPPSTASTSTSSASSSVGAAGQTAGAAAAGGASAGRATATSGQTAGTSGQPAAATSGQTAGTMGATPSGGGSMGAAPSGGGTMGATPTPKASDDESTKSLKGVPTEKLATMSDAEFKARMENTSFTDLNKNQIDYIRSDKDKSAVAAESFKNQAVNNFTDGLKNSVTKTDWAKAAADNAPKGENPPQAVQVRVTNPDKL